MNKIFVLAIGLLIMGIPALASATAMGAKGFTDDGTGAKSFEFDSMKTVSGTMLGDDLFNRGVFGSTDDHVLKSAKGKLGDDGKLSIDVSGLVKAADHVNSEAAFSAVASCTDDLGNVVNVATKDWHAADDSGNVSIKEDLANFPKTCLEPMIFVTGMEGNAFAFADSSFKELRSAKEATAAKTDDKTKSVVKTSDDKTKSVVKTSDNKSKSSKASY